VPKDDTNFTSDRQPGDVATEGWARTDGGVDIEPPSIEDSREYAAILERLTELDRRLRSNPESLERSQVVQCVREYLALDYQGGGYLSGLVKAVRLIVHYQIETNDLSGFNVPRSPHEELIEWCLSLDRGGGSEPLDSDHFEFCLDRSEWHQVLIRAMESHGAKVPLTDDQLVRLSTADIDSLSVVHTASILEEREQSDAATKLIERAFDSTTSLQTPVPLLEAATNLGLEQQFRRHLRGSLNRWGPDQGVARLESLVELGRQEELYSEIVLAVERWLRECEPQPTDENGRLIAASIEALLRGTDTGRDDALELYQRYLYPADDVFDIGSDLFEAADAAGRPEISEDVLAAYNTDSFVPGESDLETGMMAAKSAEQSDHWHDAFDIWSTLLEEYDDPLVCRNAIENRLRSGDLETAEEYIDKLEDKLGGGAGVARYSIRVADRRNNARRVVETVDSTDDLFDDSSDEAEDVAMAYVESLASLGRWGRLESFLEDEQSLRKKDHRFYERLAKLMQYVQEDGASVDGQTAIDITERLLSAPVETSELQLLLNLGVVRKVADRVRKERPDLEERLDVVEGLVEILVSLHAERFIDELQKADVDTEQFEQNLSEADLRRGGRQLLTDLEREARRAGLTKTH